MDKVVALMWSVGTPYELAARQHAIQQTPAVEVFKAVAAYEALFESLDRPPLPPALAIVLPKRDWEV